MSDWTDRIVGDRMAVDREFGDRVHASEFTTQQWELIMTAVEFDIENADDPERARIVADTTRLPQILPELEKEHDRMSVPGGRSEADGRGGVTGIIDAVRSSLGLGGSDGGDEETIAAAERLTDAYAEALQERLEEVGKWSEIRDAHRGR